MMIPRNILYTAFTVSLFAAAGTNLRCSENNTTKKESVVNTKKQESPSVITLRSTDEFKQIIDQSGDRLLIFDLYADWCMPCRVLSPMLEKIASEQKGKATFYKVNVDKLPAVAQAFQVQGIPYVVFIRNKQAVYALTGVRAKADYVSAIAKFGNNEP